MYGRRMDVETTLCAYGITFEHHSMSMTYQNHVYTIVCLHNVSESRGKNVRALSYVRTGSMACHALSKHETNHCFLCYFHP